MTKHVNRISFVSIVACIVMIVASASNTGSTDRPETSPLARVIEKKIAGETQTLRIRGERLHAPDMLRDFYKRRDYRPAWVDGSGLRTQVYSLISSIEKADHEGLIPDYYHLRTIRALLGEIRKYGHGVVSPVDMRADLDLLLSDAFLLLGCHYSAGCVNPVTLEADWHVKPKQIDIISVFEKAIKEDRIQESLQKLLPSKDMYTELKKNLFSYRKLSGEGGWPVIPGGKLMKKGKRDNRVSDLRTRLEISGYLPAGIGDAGDTYTFDSDMEDAVIRFQKLHGLSPDGVVGYNTLKALNVPAEERVRQIELNMERLRWIAKNLGHRYIMVNIADFTLKVVEHGHTVLSMKVIVGKPYWHTPVFTEKMTHLIVNPYWNVPPNIARKEILPKVRRDAGYLKKEDMKVLSGWGRNAREIDPGSVDWDAAGSSAFKYRFRQEPGPRNPLGRIKFMFPNRFDVYLHDTPGKSLFERDVRSFSHGCIRLEKPLVLSEYVLKQDPRWTPEKISAEIAKGSEREIRLDNPIDVYILYLTAWVDGDGLLNFRDDVYGRDAKLNAELKKPPPS